MAPDAAVHQGSSARLLQFPDGIDWDGNQVSCIPSPRPAMTIWASGQPGRSADGADGRGPLRKTASVAKSGNPEPEEEGTMKVLRFYAPVMCVSDAPSQIAPDEILLLVRTVPPAAPM